MRLHGGAFGFGLGLLLAVGALLGFCASAFADTAVVFKPSETPPREFKVPAGVSEITVVAVGGAGQAGPTCFGEPEGGGAGGAGAKITATLQVHEGETLYVEFAGAGAGGATIAGEGRCNRKGGNGGSASDLRSEADSLASRLLVAGGGGGGGAGGGKTVDDEKQGDFAGAGGNAGPSPEKGGTGLVEGVGPLLEAGLGGGAGGESSGGNGGSADLGCFSGVEVGYPGTVGQGGEGYFFVKAKEAAKQGEEGSCENAGGGGGGGGYYGGGGGGGTNAPGGGGAGSSYVTSKHNGTPKVESGAGLPQQLTISYTSAKAPTSMSSELSGGGKSGEDIEVSDESSVVDTVKLTGTNAAKATGTVVFRVYFNKQCTGSDDEREGQLEAGGVATSTSVQDTSPGVYYWTASYAGDALNGPSESPCRAEVATVVKASPVLSTKLAGGGQSGTAITVTPSADVRDQASIANELFPLHGEGTVTYTLYSDSACSHEASGAGAMVDESTAIPPLIEWTIPVSDAQELSPGEYYWQASFSGDEWFLPAVSECGSEVEKVSAAPSAKIEGPGEGGVYSQGELVKAVFSCLEGEFGPGLTACEDSNKASGGAGQLNTSALGQHEYTVTATSKDGQTGTAKIKYTVAAPPAATIKSPGGGGVYSQGEVIKTTFSCSEGEYGSGLASCEDSNKASGGAGALKTSEVGEHEYTVTATSKDGQSSTARIKYTVGAPCKTAAGYGQYIKLHESKPLLQVWAKLTTNVAKAQELRVNGLDGAARFALSTLTSARCIVVGSTATFSGQGKASEPTEGRKLGWTISFSITISKGQASFTGTLRNKSGGIIHEVSEPLLYSTMKIS